MNEKREMSRQEALDAFRELLTQHDIEELEVRKIYVDNIDDTKTYRRKIILEIILKEDQCIMPE